MKNTKTAELSDAEEFENINSFDQVPAGMSLILKRLRNLEAIIENMENNSQPKDLKAPITSITELAKFLGIARCTAQGLKNSGRIPFIQFGKKLIIDPDKVLISLNGYMPPKRKKRSTVPGQQTPK